MNSNSQAKSPGGAPEADPVLAPSTKVLPAGGAASAKGARLISLRERFAALAAKAAAAETAGTPGVTAGDAPPVPELAPEGVAPVVSFPGGQAAHAASPAPVVSFPGGDAAPAAASPEGGEPGAGPEPAPPAAAFPFPSLDFPGRAALTVREVAIRLGYSEKHIANLIDTGRLSCIEGRVRDGGRSACRIPVECYRDFLLLRLTGRARLELLRELPKGELHEIVRELNTFLAAS